MARLRKKHKLLRGERASGECQLFYTRFLDGHSRQASSLFDDLRRRDLLMTALLIYTACTDARMTD